MLIESGTFAGLRKNGYGIIMADPAWTFRAGGDRGPSMHYKTMKLQDIKDMPVADLAAPDCALFLWTSPPLLKQSMGVMDAWGFRYISTGFIWVKLRKRFRDALWFDDDVFLGLGFTTRHSSEFCLLGKRGKPKRLDKGVPEVILAARREHSRKPDQAFQRAARLYGGEKLELFSRESRPGWHTWGHEQGKFDSPADPALRSTGGNHRLARPADSPETDGGYTS